MAAVTGTWGEEQPSTGLSASIVFVAAAGVAGAWIAAGCVGLLAGPLRIALTWLALMPAVLSCWPFRSAQRGLVACVLLLGALPLAVPASPIHELLLVSAVLALAAESRPGAAGRALSVCANAVLALAVFRLACLSVPAIWRMSDAAGAALGRVAGLISGRPLAVGATFAGLDELVLMAALVLGWCVSTPERRLANAACAAAAVAAGHLLYLVLLAVGQGGLAAVPVLPEPEFVHPYVPPPWRWEGAVRQLLPWNLPALGAAIHLSLLVLILRWGRWPSDTDAPASAARALDGSGRWRPARAWSLWHVPPLLALAASAASILFLAPTDLSGKRIVANERGLADWNRPQPDRYGAASAGTFGMLPILVQSLGGQLRRSREFAASELAGADVVAVLQPSSGMPASQRDRIWDYVRRGGSLLVVAGPFLRQGDEESGLDQMLAPAGIRVRRDVAISATPNWQHACQPLLHAATRGLQGERNYFSSAAGASLRIGGGACPLVVGRWGWSDPGSDAMLTGTYQFEAGERLGDLVLAAERRVGRGTVVVLGDGFSLTNEGSVGGYEWAAGLLSYLARRPGSAGSACRHAMGLLLCLALVAATGWCHPRRTALVAMVLGVSLAAGSQLSRHAGRVLPDGAALRREGAEGARGLAYIDASHVEAYSDIPWGFDAINGLALTLMRDGYLTLAMPAMTRERLERASLLLSIAPARAFSPDEIVRVRDFVRGGGVLISMVGAEDATGSRSLLADFGLRVPASPVPTGGQWEEPEPLGRHRSLFLDARDYGAGDYKAGVVFFAAWPVEASGEGVDVLARGRSDYPVVVARQFGRGTVVVIGDTAFAMNKNLEYVTGEPFEGKYENAHFWRWLLTRVTGRPEWVPPREAAGHAAEGTGKGGPKP